MSSYTVHNLAKMNWSKVGVVTYVYAKKYISHNVTEYVMVILTLLNLNINININIKFLDFTNH
jgi:hypothetical protein